MYMTNSDKNDYFVPKRNKHYSRYMFLKLRPNIGETTVAYATRLREKAHDCDFGTNNDERILEHLLQTIENKMLIQKCIEIMDTDRVSHRSGTDRGHFFTNERHENKPRGT